MMTDYLNSLAMAFLDMRSAVHTNVQGRPQS